MRRQWLARDEPVAPPQIVMRMMLHASCFMLHASWPNSLLGLMLHGYCPQLRSTRSSKSGPHTQLDFLLKCRDKGASRQGNLCLVVGSRVPAHQRAHRGRYRPNQLTRHGIHRTGQARRPQETVAPRDGYRGASDNVWLQSSGFACAMVGLTWPTQTASRRIGLAVPRAQQAEQRRYDFDT